MNRYKITHTTMTGSALQSSRTKEVLATSMLGAKIIASKWKGKNAVSGKWHGNNDRAIKTRGYALDARLTIERI